MFSARSRIRRRGAVSACDEVAKACDPLALMASKGCVLVNWQPRHKQDEEAAGEEASTGAADTEPSTQHVAPPNGCAKAQAVRRTVVCRTVASAAVTAITK